MDPAPCWRRHDSWAVFSALGDLVETGPTLTNVNDFRAVLVT
jgi:glycerate-2-kinase